MGEAIDRLRSIWDEVTEDFLAGKATNVRQPLDAYFTSYKLADEVQLEGFCEPFLGDLGVRPRMAFLSLNPGQLVPSYQALDHEGREGIFVSELRELGSYTAWAASWPYLHEPWRTFVGARTKGQDHHGVRLRFMRDWYADPTLPVSDRIDFELYPWHSIKFVGSALKLDVALLRDFVWDPLADLQASWVFAFGAWWWENLERLGVEVVARLGDRGDRPFDVGYKTGSKQGVAIAVAPHGGVIVAEKHGGPPPGPPRSDLVPHFKEQILAALPPSIKIDVA